MCDALTIDLIFETGFSTAAAVTAVSGREVWMEVVWRYVEALQGEKYTLLVDELLGQMQAVVKSLDANNQRVEGLVGATILGDGRVAMSLDIHGLAQLHTQFGAGTPVSALAVHGSDNFFGGTS